MIHKCDQCGESFTQKCHLNRHIQSKHADVKYSCDKCNFQATRKDSLNRHIKSKHAKSSEKFIEQNNDDPIADAASEFWQPWKNKPEKRKNSDTFIDQNSFAAEEKEPEPEKKKRRDNDNRNENDVEHKFKCPHPHCSLSLSSRGNLQKHIKLKHSNTFKHFICDQCGQGFPRNDYLINHMKKHEKEKAKKPPIKVKTRINIEEEPRAENDESSTSESAFKRMLLTKEWKIRKATDILTTMKKYNDDLKRSLINLLVKNPVKFYITLIITSVRKNQSGITERSTNYFQGKYLYVIFFFVYFWF